MMINKLANFFLIILLMVSCVSSNVKDSLRLKSKLITESKEILLQIQSSFLSYYQIYYRENPNSLKHDLELWKMFLERSPLDNILMDKISEIEKSDLLEKCPKINETLFHSIYELERVGYAGILSVIRSLEYELSRYEKKCR